MNAFIEQLKSSTDDKLIRVFRKIRSGSFYPMNKPDAIRLYNLIGRELRNRGHSLV